MALLNDLLLNAGHFWLFENTLSADEPGWLFTDPIDTIIASHPEEVPGALQLIDQQRQRGHYLAGFINYEAGYALHKPLQKLNRKSSIASHPILEFHIFKQAHYLSKKMIDDALEQLPDSAPWIRSYHYSETETAYLEKLNRLQRYIEAGDTYQVNHTLRLDLELEGSATSLYRSLRQRQPVSYSALVSLAQQTILSLSPELFISKRGTTLQTKPMKGTAKRVPDPVEDAKIVEAMRRDNKIKSENLMIVDLMRNDIGYLADPGTVKVHSLFEIQTYETLHQMISTITGTVDQDIKFSEVVRGLFPCGSITGAPKIRTMEIIHELENRPRDLYTGALGFITPGNDFTFNVPIRTLQFPKGKQQGVLGVGGGIIYDSKPEEEWQECLVKTHFLTGLNQQVKLIETLRYDHQRGEIKRLALHMNRLSNSAVELGFVIDETQIRQQLQQYLTTQSGSQDLKLRLLADYQGRITISSEPLSEAEMQPDSLSPTSLPSVIIHQQPIKEDDLFRRHKTTNRALYNRAYQEASDLGHYDVLFINQSGHIAEASRHNLLIKKSGRFYTPLVSDGALPGIMRQTLLADKTLSVEERSLTVSDLQNAEKIYLSNSVRGTVEVVMVP